MLMKSLRILAVCELVSFLCPVSFLCDPIRIVSFASKLSSGSTHFAIPLCRLETLYSSEFNETLVYSIFAPNTSASIGFIRLVWLDLARPTRIPFCMCVNLGCEVC